MRAAYRNESRSASEMASIMDEDSSGLSRLTEITYMETDYFSDSESKESCHVG